MAEKIHHIGIAVNDIQKSLNRWGQYLTFKKGE